MWQATFTQCLNWLLKYILYFYADEAIKADLKELEAFSRSSRTKNC